MKDKQLNRVLEAVKNGGARDSFDVSEITRIPVATCSAYLSTLESMGLIRSIGTQKRAGRGRQFKFYEPVGERV
jgi:DNA-binding IclR family transcriptional regulator